ncbi:hypothetical protein HAQ01_13795 [Acidithiobacillus thiooxidans]|uniref:hypothetical protein n=1 Tax=Acidithiobacillus thiooxidans TaxID=930 RepID=UPI001C069197|nr:hypothetical protein [Acidithiobacillus thiooxidans]MBU2794429.1 hypothetical protein [Acidithiobacillus thiooxidans]
MHDVSLFFPVVVSGQAVPDHAQAVSPINTHVLHLKAITMAKARQDILVRKIIDTPFASQGK